MTEPALIPGIGVGIVIRRGDEVLLLRRHNVHGAGTWSTPGGYFEYGETPEECAAREALEETGVTITGVRFLAVTNDFFPERQKHFSNGSGTGLCSVHTAIKSRPLAPCTPERAGHPPCMNRPVKVEALSGFRLRLTYTDGVEGVIDLAADVGRGVFTSLADEAFFRTVHIGQFGQIAWSEDIEICPDAAYREIAHPAVPADA